jgi:hypothetical protein
VVGGGCRVAVDSEPFVDGEAFCDELAPVSLADNMSSVRLVSVEDVEGVLLHGFDGDGRAGWWPATVVLSARRRVKQSVGEAVRGKMRNGGEFPLLGHARTGKDPRTWGRGHRRCTVTIVSPSAVSHTRMGN